MTHPKQDHPEEVQRHLPTKAIRNGIREDHGQKLTQRLEGTPQSRIVGSQCVYAGSVRVADTANEAEIGDNISV